VGVDLLQGLLHYCTATTQLALAVSTPWQALQGPTLWIWPERIKFRRFNSLSSLWKEGD